MNPEPPREALPMTAGEAFAAVLYGAVAADGVVSQAEALALTHALFHTSMFRGLAEGQTRAILGRVRDLHKAHGAQAVLKAAASKVPADLRQTAFAQVVDLAFGDDELDDAERAYIKAAQAALGVPDGDAAKVLEVLRVLHKA